MSQPIRNQEQSLSTRTLLLAIWGYISRRRRRQLFVLLIVMLASGLAELVSLGSVLPFLDVLNDPKRFWNEPSVQAISYTFGFNQPSDLILPASFIFAISAVLAASIRLANLWLSGRIAAAVGSDLSCEAYLRTLYQPYSVHVQRNTSSVITSSTNQINVTVSSLNNLLVLVSSSFVAAGLIAGLFIVNWPMALGSLGLFVASYVVLATTARLRLRSNGKSISEATKQQLKALQEGLGAIRDVLLDGSQATYLRIYQQADRPQRQLQADNVFISSFPRYAFEALGLVSIALIGGLLRSQQVDSSSVIPILGALALGAQRLLPALQQIYSSWAALKGNTAAMQDVLEMLNQPLPTQLSAPKAFNFKNTIRFESVSFRYALEQPDVLRDLDLEILHGERIGVIGSTGSGKSTTVDLLMGLLEPTTGRILVDGKNLHDPKTPELLLAWRASIAHVPQSIYLADSSIAENIAFGVPIHEIDYSRVEDAAKQAQISGFIESSAGGYSSYVGERGIRLSGGQRQRIGIARALYKQANVVVLDEATSALDNKTEEAVMSSVEGLSRDLTIIIIAHRLSTILRCDRVLKLRNGMIENASI